MLPSVKWLSLPGVIRLPLQFVRWRDPPFQWGIQESASGCGGSPGNLLATKTIEENIRKARRAFFLLGSLRFGPTLGQVSGATCVLPVLLYGCENWILSEGDLELLEAFQGELAKRILKLPKHFSNTAAVTALDWPSVRARMLLRKLAFLKKVAEAEADTLVGGAMRAFLDERQSLCLVRECKDLEEELGVTTNLTGRLLTQNEGGIEGAVGLREGRESVSRYGKERMVESCKVNIIRV